MNGKWYRELSREELLADMREVTKKVTGSKEKAEAFLRRLGVLSEDGEPIRLIPDD